MKHVLQTILLAGLIVFSFNAQAAFVILDGGVAKPGGTVRIALDQLADGVNFRVTCKYFSVTNTKPVGITSKIYLSSLPQTLVYYINDIPVAVGNTNALINARDNNTLIVDRVVSARYIDVKNLDLVNSFEIQLCTALSTNV